MVHQNLYVPPVPAGAKGHTWRLARDRSAPDCDADVCEGCRLIRMTLDRTGQVISYKTADNPAGIAPGPRRGRRGTTTRSKAKPSTNPASTSTCRNALNPAVPKDSRDQSSIASLVSRSLQGCSGTVWGNNEPNNRRLASHLSALPRPESGGLECARSLCERHRR